MPTEPVPHRLDGPVLFKPIETARPSQAAARTRTWRTWRGLLWSEWFAHSRLILVFLVFWLLTVWLLPFVAHPGWILGVAGVYALFAGPAFGGADVIGGCEEFSLALPATRLERYLARLLVGAGSVLAFTAMDLLALGLDLSQALARFYLDTGLIKPLQVAQPGLLYGLVLAMPLAVFALAFASSAVARARAFVFTSWCWGALGALVLLRAGSQYEQWMWAKVNGRATVPLLLLAAAAAVIAGGWGYRRKEVGPALARLEIPARLWVGAVLFLLGLALAAFLALWLTRQFPQWIE